MTGPETLLSSATMSGTGNSIREQMDARLRQARVDRDEPTRNVIGMLKNKVLTELKAGKGAEENDELWLKTIAAYAKQVQKAIPELEKAGERGKEAVEEARFELAFCGEFLPNKLDEAATEELVRKVLAENDITDMKMMGKAMGVLMKSHRDELDGDLARKLVQKVLSGG